MEGSDVCFAPVLTLGEAMTHPHNCAREQHRDRLGALGLHGGRGAALRAEGGFGAA